MACMKARVVFHGAVCTLKEENMEALSDADWSKELSISIASFPESRQEIALGC